MLDLEQLSVITYLKRTEECRKNCSQIIVQIKQSSKTLLKGFTQINLGELLVLRPLPGGGWMMVLTLLISMKLPRGLRQ